MLDKLIGNGLTRRQGLQSFLASFAVYAALGEYAAAAKSRGGLLRWADGQQDLALGLSRGTLTGRQWAQGVRHLSAEVDPGELTHELAGARLEPAGTPSGNDPRKRFVRFLDADGQPRRLAYGVALFDFDSRNVVTPHGHRNMVSGHLVVRGALRVRNFDRVGDEPGRILIRPTRDHVARTGEVSTMCAEENNIHWFVPQGGPASTFDVIVSGLDAGAKDYEIQPVDPLHAVARADGVLAAPILGFEKSSRLYTADV